MDEKELLKAAQIIKNGGLVAFPTETVYGLGANALSADAVAKIYTAKGRPSRNPIIVHVASIDQAKSLVSSWSETADKLAEKFWPGPLTMILPKASMVPDIVTGGGQTVALRMPSHPIAQRLIELAEVPIAAPSANVSGRVSSTTAQHVRDGLGEAVDMILDGGPTEAGIESTVIDLSVEPPVIRRPGPIAREELEKILSFELRASSEDKGGTLVSPGMMQSHYAPKTRLMLVTSDELQATGLRLQASGKKVGLLPLMDEPQLYAAQLYAILHRFDAQNLDIILVEEPPREPQWEAVRDRLVRAAAER